MHTPMQHTLGSCFPLPKSGAEGGGAPPPSEWLELELLLSLSSFRGGRPALGRRKVRKGKMEEEGCWRDIKSKHIHFAKINSYFLL